MFCGLFSSFDSMIGEIFPPQLFVFIGTLALLPWQIFKSSLSGEKIKTDVVSMMWRVIGQMCHSTSELFVFCFVLFFMLSALNLLGLVPLCFSCTAHLSFNLSLSMVLWVAGVMFGMLKFLDNFICHLLPLGSPMSLWPMLVLVESISMFIRPLTLSIRLMANVMAGHLIISLVSKISSVGGMGLFLSIIPVTSLYMFESCVSMIQAFVFMSLLVLYWDESEH